MPCVVSRWHGVLSKYLKCASDRKLLAVHGAAALFRLMSITPRLVFRWTVNACLVSTPVSGGSSTLRAAGVVDFLYSHVPGGRLFVGDALGVALLSALGIESVPPPIFVARMMAP